MLKKFLLVLSGFVLAVAVFGVAGFAYAQTQTPPDSEYPCPYCGTNDGYLQRGHGMRGGGLEMWGTTDSEYAPLHETMLAAFADILDLSIEELETRRATGETMFEIAEAQGLTAEEFSALMFEARSVALDQAVANGFITQEQADWMQSRWEQMQSEGYGLGTGTCSDGIPVGGNGTRGGGRRSGRK